MTIRTIIGRIFVSRVFLTTLCIATLGLVVAITLNSIFHVFNHLEFDAKSEAKEETIGILLILFGVFLEGREVLAKKIFRVEEFDHMPQQKVANDVCEYYGFLLLVIGLGIELINQSCKWIESLHHVVLYVQAGINLPLNIIAALLLTIAIAKLITMARTRKTETVRQRRANVLANVAY